MRFYFWKKRFKSELQPPFPEGYQQLPITSGDHLEREQYGQVFRVYPGGEVIGFHNIINRIILRFTQTKDGSEVLAHVRPGNLFIFVSLFVSTFAIFVIRLFFIFENEAYASNHLLFALIFIFLFPAIALLLSFLLVDNPKNFLKDLERAWSERKPGEPMTPLENQSVKIRDPISRSGEILYTTNEQVVKVEQVDSGRQQLVIPINKFHVRSFSRRVLYLLKFLLLLFVYALFFFSFVAFVLDWNYEGMPSIIQSFKISFSVILWFLEMSLWVALWTLLLTLPMTIPLIKLFYFYSARIWVEDKQLMIETDIFRSKKRECFEINRLGTWRILNNGSMCTLHAPYDGDGKGAFIRIPRATIHDAEWAKKLLEAWSKFPQ